MKQMSYLPTGAITLAILSIGVQGVWCWRTVASVTDRRPVMLRCCSCIAVGGVAGLVLAGLIAFLVSEHLDAALICSP